MWGQMGENNNWGEGCNTLLKKKLEGKGKLGKTLD